MDKRDLERRLEAAEKQNLGLIDEIKNLKAQLAKLQDEPEIPKYPFVAERQKYWFVEEEDFKLNYGISIGGFSKDYNCFHTESYAQEFADKCKLIAMMLHCKWHLDRKIDSKFDGETSNYCVWYNHLFRKWNVDWNRSNESTTVYFSTQEAAQKCADWLNAHWKEDGNG